MKNHCCETNIAVLRKVAIEIGATQQVGHLSLLRNVHTTDSSPHCCVTGYPRRLNLWGQLSRECDTIWGALLSSYAIYKVSFLTFLIMCYRVCGLHTYIFSIINFCSSDSHFVIYLMIDFSAHGNGELTIQLSKSYQVCINLVICLSSHWTQTQQTSVTN